MSKESAAPQAKHAHSEKSGQPADAAPPINAAPEVPDISVKAYGVEKTGGRDQVPPAAAPSIINAAPQVRESASSRQMIRVTGEPAVAAPHKHIYDPRR